MRHYYKLNNLTNKLIAWYKKNKRDLPWRGLTDSYHIWVSEIILQQTQIHTGIKYYERFINIFPTIKDLALATEEDVLNVWQGLGYYRRALNMLSAAKTVMIQYDGLFPKEYSKLLQLPGIGIYTASAVSSICNDEKKAVVDGNVYRFLSRIYNISTAINTTQGIKEFQHIANKLIPEKNPGDYNQAIMDFGSTHCKKHNPKCNTCPFQLDCLAYQLGEIHLRPVKHKTKKSSVKYFNYLFIHSKALFLLQQRTNNDIWKKLYELPLIETTKRIDVNTLRKKKYLKQFDVIKIQKDYSVEHNLSHQKLKITFWDININNIKAQKHIQRITLEDVFKYPFAKPLQNYLKIQYAKYKN